MVILELLVESVTPVGKLVQAPEVNMVLALMELPQAEDAFPHLERTCRVYEVLFFKPLKMKGAGPQLSTMVLSSGEAASQYRS